MKRWQTPVTWLASAWLSWAIDEPAASPSRSLTAAVMMRRSDFGKPRGAHREVGDVELHRAVGLLRLRRVVRGKEEVLVDLVEAGDEQVDRPRGAPSISAA